jgi:hypothetical protein
VERTRPPDDEPGAFQYGAWMFTHPLSAPGGYAAADP